MQFTIRAQQSGTFIDLGVTNIVVNSKIERLNAKVRSFSFISGILVLNLVQCFSLDHVNSVRIAGNSPGEQVLVTKILGGFSVPPLRALVNDLNNLVYKDDDFVLETLGRFGELSDAAETENKFNSLALSVEVKTWVDLNQ